MPGLRAPRPTTKWLGPRTKIRAEGARSAAPTLARRRPMRHRMKRRTVYRHKRRQSGRKAAYQGVHAVKLRSFAGRPDAEIVKLKYTLNTDDFKLVGGAATFLQIKGNDIYKPLASFAYNATGYANMFAQYRRCVIHGSRIKVSAWTVVDGTWNQYPLNVVTVPCTSAQYAVYSAYTFPFQLEGVPHAKLTTYSPGSTIRSNTNWTRTAVVYAGHKHLGEDSDAINAFQIVGNGTAPVLPWYWLVGIQGWADQDISVRVQYEVTYYCRFMEPIAIAVPASITKEGYELAAPVEEKKSPPSEEKKEDPEFELVRIPKVRTPAPAVSSKK